MKKRQEQTPLRDRADECRRSGRLQEALGLYQQHLAKCPKDQQAQIDLGAVLMGLERFAEAAGIYSKMIEANPRQESVLSNLGAALIRLGRPADAKAILDFALEINPKNLHARINLGGVLQALGLQQENLMNALEAVSIDPTEPLAFNNLGSALCDLAKFPEAKHAFETSTLLDPKGIDAHVNLANIESKLGSPQAAIDAYQKALSLLPPEAKQRAEAIRFYMSFEYLKQGMLPEGWDCYEGGFSNLVPVAGARHPRRQFAVPRWNGEMPNGKTLLVWREQGLGDELLFASCLHELEALGGRVIVECDKRLVETFTRSFPRYTVRAEAFLPDQGMQSPYKDFDLHVPLGSLMKYFRRDIKDFERSGAYIKTDPAKVAKFEERLALYKEDYRLVGICWRSGKLDPVRNLGYTTLDEWGEVLQAPGFKFVNLQYGDCEAELQQAEKKYGVEILRWDDLNLKDDLDDVFALIKVLDKVLSVQTAVIWQTLTCGVECAGYKLGGWPFLGREFCPVFPRLRKTKSQITAFSETKWKVETKLTPFCEEEVKLFCQKHYVILRQRRLKFLVDFFGLSYLRDRKILYCGAGLGIFGSMLEELGLSVDYTDIRGRNLSAAEKLCSGMTYKVDHDGEWSVDNNSDVILFYDLLHHLQNWRASLLSALNNSRVVVLDTEVIDSTSEDMHIESYCTGQVDQGVMGRKEIRTTKSSIEAVLRSAGRSFLRFECSSLNADFHNYDWPEKNSGAYLMGQRALWVIGAS